MQTSNNNIFFGSHIGLLKTNPFIECSRTLYVDTPIIYVLNISDYAQLAKDLTAYLDIYEKEKALKFYKETDKNRYIICRSLLKFVLAYHTQSDINDLSIQLLSNKKPYLPKYPDVFFNVSHSGDHAVLAVSASPIGIDIEYMDLNYSFQEALTSIFNEKQINFINNSDHRIRAFYSLWTRKEAFVKALGKGIDDDFSKIPCLDGLYGLDVSLIKSSKNWQVHSFEIIENYLGAIAYATKQINNKKPACFSLPNNMEDLLKLSNL